MLGTGFLRPLSGRCRGSVQGSGWEAVLLAVRVALERSLSKLPGPRVSPRASGVTAARQAWRSSIHRAAGDSIL